MPGDDLVGRLALRPGRVGRADGGPGPEERLAERVAHRQRGLDGGDLLLGRRGQQRDAVLLSLGIGPRSRVDVDRVGQRQPLGDPGESCRDDRGEREVGVARRVRRLQLDVRAVRGDEHGLGHEAQRGLAVLDAPERVGAREVAGSASQQRGHARGGDRRERGQLADEPREPGLAFRREPVRAVTAGEQVLVVAHDRAVGVPAVAGRLGCDERCERRAQPVRARRGVDRLSCQQLHVGGCQWIGRADRELHLGEPVLGVQLADHDAIGIEVGQELRAELVHLEHRERPVDRPVMGGRELGIGVADEPLELVAGLQLETHRGGGLDLSLERVALAVDGATAILLELAPGSPRERGLAREAPHPVVCRTQPEIARGRGERLMPEGDPVRGREHREERRDAHAALDRVLELRERHRPRAGDAVHVRERDRETADALESQHRSATRRLCAVAALGLVVMHESHVLLQLLADAPREAGERRHERDPRMTQMPAV